MEILGVDMDLLITIASQLPVVVIFVYFVLQMLDRNEKAIERRENQWQKFLDENQERSISAYKSVANELQALVKCMSEQTDLLRSHDDRVLGLAGKVENFLGDYELQKKMKQQQPQNHYGDQYETGG
jgi:hypothetical protein